MRLSFCLALLFLANIVSAEPRCEHAVRHAAAGAVLLGLGQSSEALKSSLAPSAPRWTDETLSSIDALGDKLRWSRKLDKNAASLSDVTLPLTVGTALVIGIGEHARGACLVEDAGVWAETAGSVLLLTQTAKFLAARERPFVRDLSEEEKAIVCDDLNEGQCTDLNLSFFSGHTSMSLAGSLAAASIAGIRGYDGKTAAYAFGITGAVLTGYLRIAAGKHYLSDVLTGAIVGSAGGIFLPKLLLPIKNAVLLPSAQGLSLLGVF